MQLFTVAQANRTLPLVRRIVEDLVREVQRHEALRRELDVLEAGPREAAVQREVLDVEREMAAFTRELRDLGIQLKDPRIGLIDFPSNIDGRRVLLCWRLGEPAVQFWHDEDAGFAGRQPLSPTLAG